MSSPLNAPTISAGKQTSFSALLAGRLQEAAACA
jgi:hypothetical protein